MLTVGAIVFLSSSFFFWISLWIELHVQGMEFDLDMLKKMSTEYVEAKKHGIIGD
jgi:hypothetical protein